MKQGLDQAVERLAEQLVADARNSRNPNERADARALWAVRVLDAWAETAGDWARGWESCRRPGAFWVTLSDGGKQSFHGPTPDAARLAAAQAVYPELPESVRAELGECP